MVGRKLINSRDYVLNELCLQLNLKSEEKNIEPYDVYTADEAFMTGTPFCLLPTISLNGIKIGDGRMGKITKKLLCHWSNNVGLDIENQIREYGKEVAYLNSNAPTPYQFKRN